MQISAANYVKVLAGIALAALCAWVGATGRLGSLLGAWITPGSMAQGQPPAPGSNAPTLSGAQSPPGSDPRNSTEGERWAYIWQVFGAKYGQQALDISGCESSWNPLAYNPTPVSGSHAEGLFQILVPSTWQTTSQAANNPYDYQANTQAAWEIFKRDGYSWREWACAAKFGYS